MTRVEAFTISLIFAFVILGLMAVIFLLLFPYEQVFSPTPTITPTMTLTLRPTSARVFLPTPSLETPTPSDPTPTNTRIPTLTPTLPRQPSPTVVIQLPTPLVRPTVAAPPPLPEPPGPVTPTATLVPQRQYEVIFFTRESTIADGECTTLEWRIDGPVSVWLDDQPVSRAGSRQVCPERDTEYTLKIQVEGNAQINQQKVRVNVD